MELCKGNRGIGNDIHFGQDGHAISAALLYGDAGVRRLRRSFSFFVISIMHLTVRIMHVTYHCIDIYK